MVITSNAGRDHEEMRQLLDEAKITASALQSKLDDSILESTTSLKVIIGNVFI
jgi:hypothetical protein